MAGSEPSPMRPTTAAAPGSAAGPLTIGQVGPARGPVTVYVNGQRYRGDPAAITLTSHEDVQLDVATPAVQPRKLDWSHTQL